MKVSSIFLLLLSLIRADEQSPSLAERLVSTLPELPSVIRGSFNGETGVFQKMISNVLGDGLISQLVNDPLQVAGQVLPDLGGNSTNSKSHENLSKNLLRFLTTTSKPTTEKTMLVDGVEVDFDEFIRKHSLEKQFSTKKPLPLAPTPPSAEKIADEVFNKIQNQMENKNEIRKSQNNNIQLEAQQQIERPSGSPRYFLPPLNPDPSSLYNMDYIQRFVQKQGDGFGGNPPGFQQTSTYPTLAVLNEPSNSSYEEIRRLKELLSAYEEVVQTKDFFSKRKQLQDLENQLELHRSRINEQQQLENNLRKKEKELQLKKKEMELQLHAQLKSWNLTEIAETTTTQITTSSIRSTSQSHVLPNHDPISIIIQERSFRDGESEIRVQDDEFGNDRQQFQSSRQNSQDVNRHVTYSPVDYVAKAAKPITQTTCDCKKLSTNMLEGDWTIAFATSNMLERTSEVLRSTIGNNDPNLQICNSLTFSSDPTQDMREINAFWNVFQKGYTRMRKIDGYFKRMEDRTMVVEGELFNQMFGERVCALKTSSVDGKYDYVLFSVVEESCREVVLLVRNLQLFFNEENEDLTKYLKNKIDNNEIEQMHMSPYSC